MLSEKRRPYTFSAVLAAFMAAQSLLGLLFQQAYHYPEGAAPAWLGNDLITLIIAVPLLITGMSLARRGSIRGLLLWLGVLAYSALNYAHYLFGATLNAFFLLYVVALALCVAALVVLPARIDAPSVATGFGAKTPARTIGAYFVLLGAGFFAAWTGIWGTHVFAAWPTPVEAESFKSIIAVDIMTLVPALVLGGVLLWRHRAWGYLLAPSAGIATSLYLLVLTANSYVAFMLGIPIRLGEWTVWGGLLVVTVAASGVLLWSARAKDQHGQARGKHTRRERPGASPRSHSPADTPTE